MLHTEEARCNQCTHARSRPNPAPSVPSRFVSFRPNPVRSIQYSRLLLLLSLLDADAAAGQDKITEIGEVLLMGSGFGVLDRDLGLQGRDFGVLGRLLGLELGLELLQLLGIDVGLELRQLLGMLYEPLSKK